VQFLPRLKRFVQKARERQEDGARLQVVYVSSDKSQKVFDAYFKKHDWLAVPYADCDAIRRPLEKRFGVSGIPSCVLLQKNGGGDFEEVTREAREKIGGDPGRPFAVGGRR
jgi:hypothetical protein